MIGLASLLLHILLMAGASVLLAGLLPWARARWAGRAGPPIWQPWRDWRRLMRKRPLVAEGTSPLQVWAPALSLAVTIMAALLVPSLTLGMITASLSDLLVILGLLGLARVITVLAAIDAGTAEAGLVAIRQVRLGALAEPALLLVVLTIALLTGTTNLDAALAALHDAAAPGVPMLLALVGLASVVLAVEMAGTTRMTDYAGWHEAASEATVALRRVVWFSLVAALIAPGGMALGPPDWLLGLLLWSVKLAILAAICVASGPALLRIGQARVDPLLGAAVLLGVLAVVFLFVGQGLA
jgi:formate hydrogenlyase subunit 4